MQFQQMNVEGFGTLSACRMEGLSSGLNVIYGTNGAGKTTLVRFLSGVLCGFDEARRLRLLPPLKAGTPGGSIRVKMGAGLYDVIRHARTDHKDTLAISLIQGTANEVTALRKTIQSLPADLVQTLAMATGFGTHDLAGLVQLAQRHGVELYSRTNSGAWMTDHIRALEAERDRLSRIAPKDGDLLTLEKKRDRLAHELRETCQTQMDQLAKWQHSLKTLRERIEALIRERDWLDLEIQSVQTDLTEIQDRLWSTRTTVVQEVETVQQPVVESEPKWVSELAAIDREIGHIQQVLRDLAGSRMHISVSKAALAGAEVPDVESVLQRQRQSLSIIESQCNQLTAVLSSLSETSQCICGSRSGALQTKVDRILQQVWLICQELGRQQSAHEQELLQSQREGVDRCEHELIRQIQRLRLRRDHLLNQRGRTDADRIHFRTNHESAGCECEGHDHAVADWEMPVHRTASKPQVIVTERTVTVSAARPGDAELERSLLVRLRELRRRKEEAVSLLRTARVELAQLELAARELASDRSAQALRHEFSVVEQQLADAREQWQSLTLLQTVYQRTQQKLNVESVAPVLKEASAYLARMTMGRYSRLRWDQKEGALLVLNGGEQGLPAQALSRGTLEQAVLSFRLALCNEFRRRGICLPLVLDEVLTDSDEDRMNAAIEVLVDFAQSQQVIFLTCQEHLYNMFSGHQVTAMSLSGSLFPVRKAKVETVVAVPAAKSVSEPDSAIHLAVNQTESTASGSATVTTETVFADRERLQPDEPYWLQTSSPVKLIPSLGEQMSRRLGALGVRTVGDLVELDPDNSEMPLDALQISAATLRMWKAEARLLVCVAGLTGRDAQLLAMCGVHSPAELAESDVMSLFGRIAQIRSRQSLGNSTPWLLQQPEWPSQSQVEYWIRQGRNARTWKAALQWSDSRKANLRTMQTKKQSGSSDRVLTSESSPRTGDDRRVVEHEIQNSENWKFYLFTHSPIVDAPSIGPRMAERLKAIGIHTVAQLLKASPVEIARRLKRREVTAETVTDWQHQSRMMCTVPQMRGHDVQVLVTCKITNAEMLASMTPAELYARIKPFVHSKEGTRLLRSSKVPDLEEVTDWIHFARQAPSVKAA